MRLHRTQRNSRINRAVKYFVSADLALFAGWGFVAPIMPVFIVEQLTGATLVTVGVSAGLYWLARSFIQPPIAIAIDKRRGEKDDLYVLMFGLILAGFATTTLAIITTPAQLYVVQIIYGLALGMYSVSWTAIFSRHIDGDRLAFDWSLDRSTLGIAIAISSFAGGAIASQFGFRMPFVIAGMFAFISAFIVFLSQKFILPTSKSGAKLQSPDLAISSRQDIPINR